MRLTLYRLFLMIVPILLFAEADKGLELIHTDKHIGKKVRGEQLRIFSGHVHFKQDSIHMFCREAVFHEEKKRIDFTGQVLIDDGHRAIRAKRIEYYTDTKLAVCFDSVRIKTKEDSLFTDFLTYNFTTDKAKAEGHVFLLSKANLTRIWGEKGFYNPEENHALVQGDSRFMRVDTTSGDTLNITAFELNYFSGDSAKAVAIDSVVILQGKLKAVCDSAVYFREQEMVDLRIAPHAWYEESELAGEFITAFFDSLKLTKIEVEGDAKATSLADSAKNTLNVLKGRKIDFYVKNNNPERIVAMENASSVYYLKDDADNSDQGANFSTADTIFIYFKDGELDSIRINGGAQGVYYPQDYQGEMGFE